MCPLFFIKCNGSFGLFSKLKRGLGLASGKHFLHDFSIKVFFISLSMDKVSMSHLITFSRYQTKCVIKFLSKTVDDIINFKIFPESTSKAMADREKSKEGENTKI